MSLKGAHARCALWFQNCAGFVSVLLQARPTLQFNCGNG
jgi:hypothetical protein